MMDRRRRQAGGVLVLVLIGVADDGTLPGLTSADVRRLNQLIGNAATQHMRSPISPKTENVPLGRARPRDDPRLRTRLRCHLTRPR
jgi:hypothetical protein